MSGAQARAVADAVLYEGCLLYPYGARAGKNRVRWQWGVVGPSGVREHGAGEGSTVRIECLLEADASTRVDVTLRFLQMQQRCLQRTDQRADQTALAPVDELVVGERRWLAWDETVEHEVAVEGVAVCGLAAEPRDVAVEIPGGDSAEVVTAPSGVVAGRVVRRRWPLRGLLRIAPEPVGAGAEGTGVVRLRVQLDNCARWPGGRDRTVALRRSLVAAHLLLEARDGAFVSLLDPPDALRDAARACVNERMWPVLAGEPGSRDTVLASPIILYDHPEIAPESPGDLFDATEIDELLTLRVMTLTDAEKAEARATDRRAAAIVERADSMPPEALERLHGAVRSLRAVTGEAAAGTGVPAAAPREPAWPTLTTPPEDAGSSDDGARPWWDPHADAAVSPDTDSVTVRGVAVSRGARVRLRPSRRADAHDVFLAGRAATVAGVHRDVDGGTHVAVTVDDDPGADLYDASGRYLYFAPDELEPLEVRP